MRKEHIYLLTGVVLGASIVIGAQLYSSSQPPQVSPVEYQIPVPEPQLNNNIIKGYSIPEKFSFAEETIPLEDERVRQRLEREIQVNAFWHSNSVILIKRAHQWLPLIDSILQAHNIPSDFKYMAVAESSLSNVVSPSRAVGFWQFLKGTARDFGLTVNSDIDQRYDPVASTIAATKYLNKSYERFGSWTTVAASYNMGMSATSKIIEKQHANSYYEMFISEEPSRYVFRIAALKYLLENSQKLGFRVADDQKYTLPKTKDLRISKSISDMHNFAAQNGVSYYVLRKLNPWIRGYRLSVRSGQSFIIKLPAE